MNYGVIISVETRGDKIKEFRWWLEGWIWLKRPDVTFDSLVWREGMRCRFVWMVDRAFTIRSKAKAYSLGATLSI